jgi:hypothetical protein
MKLHRFLRLLEEQATLPQPSRPFGHDDAAVLSPGKMRNPSPWIRRAVYSFSLILLAFVGFSVYRMNVDPVATVTVDFNPSLQFQINRFGRVVEVSSSQALGQWLLEDLDVSQRPIEQAIQATYDAAVEKGLVGSTGVQYFLLGVSAASYASEAALTDRIRGASTPSTLRLLFLTQHSAVSETWFGIGSSALSPAFNQQPSSEDVQPTDRGPIDSIYDIVTPLELLTSSQFSSLASTLAISEAKLAVVIRILIRENQTENHSRLIQLANTDINQLILIYLR